MIGTDQINSQMLFILLHIPLTYFVKKSPLHKVQQQVGFRQYKEAKELLDQMINESKNVNFELLNLRAKCNLNLNIIEQCVFDVNTILNLNSTDAEKKEALSTLTQLYIKTGELEKAEKYANLSNSSVLIQNVKELQDMNQQFETFYQLKQLKEASSVLDKILEYSPLNDNLILNRTEIAWNQKDYNSYNKYGSDFEIKYPKDSKIVFRRGIILMCNGSISSSISKFKQSLQMRNPPLICSSSLKLADKISNLLKIIEDAYTNNNTRLLKNSINELNSSSLKFCTKDDKLTQQVYLSEVRLMRLNLQIDDAFEYLNQLISKYPKSREFQFEKADIDLSLHNYDAAIETYKSIQKDFYLDQINIEKAQEKINHANLLKRKSFYIDYYAFLGLNRDRCLQYTTQNVKDAYKKVVRHWHPDRFSDPDKKKEAEKIMKHINSAYDVLTNQKLKDLYDKGVDPYNPTDEKPVQFSDQLEAFFASADLYDEKREGPLRIQIEI